MKKLKSKLLILSGTVFFLTFSNLQAQENSKEQERIDHLLELKKEMSKDNEIGDRYKVQLFYGNNGKADEVIKEYRSKYRYPSTITYDSPNYKVLVGNFRNRLEADRALLKIRKDFPSAFIPKPRRK